MEKVTPLKEEVKEDLSKRGLLKEEKKPEQPNLFGDQDFVYNVLQTDLTDIDSLIAKAHETIAKKESQIEELKGRKEEVEKAVKIVANQKKELKKKTKKEGKDA